MPKKSGEAHGAGMLDLLKKELAGKGYTVELSTERMDGEVMAKLVVTNVETNQSFVKLIGIGRIYDLKLALGFHLSEEILRELMTRTISFLDILKEAIPTRPVSESSA